MATQQTTRTRTINETITKVTCDHCGKNAKRSCRGCGRDICEKCTVYDDRDHGDYPGTYCIPCWKLGESYRKKQVELNQQIDEMEIAWHEACTTKH